jgi:aminoglycoside phosphotransferase (APT) family kinase protein
MDYTDQPRNVREGEALDAAKVEAYLTRAVPGLSGPVAVRQFPSGYSNLTYLVTVGTRELVVRRPPIGRKAKTAHDMAREFRMLTALRPVFPYVPRALAYCDDESVIGGPFYVMDRVPGIIPRRDFPAGMTLTPGQARRLCERLVDVWAELHAVDAAPIGLADFGKPEGYVRRQVEGWSARYRDARTPDAPEFETVMAWLAERMPPDSGVATIIHNDYKFDNLVLDPADPTRIVGVLDWEMATIGDPWMDLGASLAYWVEATDPEPLQMMRRLPTMLPGMMTRREVVARDPRATGRAAPPFDV